MGFSSLASFANYIFWPHPSTVSWPLPLGSRQGLGLPSEDLSCLPTTALHSGAFSCLKRSPAVISEDPTCCLASVPRVQLIIFGRDLRLFLLVFHHILQKLSQIKTSYIRATPRRTRTVMIFPSFHVRVGPRITRNRSMKGGRTSEFKGKIIKREWITLYL